MQARIEDGRSCFDVVTQLGAASTAIDRASLKMVVVGLKQCSVDGVDVDSLSVDEMEKLLLSIA